MGFRGILITDGIENVIECVKEANDYRGGNYYVDSPYYYHCFCFVTYEGYANTEGSSYGQKYSNRWKVIYDQEEFERQGLE